MNQTVITFEAVSKSYPLYHHVTAGVKKFLFNLPQAIKALRTAKMQVFSDLSFEVRQGETFGIIGRNGAGKSTALGLIAGVLMPSQGRVIIRGRVSPLLELGAGFHPELSGRENILLNGVLMGLSRRQVAGKAEQIIEFSELGPHIDQPVRTYSTGMLARLGFSVVAHLEPEILLIDEILAVGDMNFQNKCLQRMTSFKNSGVTMVFVSHALQEVENLCDRVLWLDRCTARMIGTPKQVLPSYVQDLTSPDSAGRAI